MTAPVVQIGLVGFGSIARSHLSALRGLPATRPLRVRPVVSVIVSERADAVREEAQALGVERVMTSVEEALADGALALLDVTTRNDRHRAQALAILEAGRGLYIEKPIGRTAAEALEIAERAERSSAPSQAGLVMRYEPAVVEARALLRAGAIGEVRHGRFAIAHGSYLDPDRPISWRLQAARSGGGAMLDLGMHLLDSIRFLLGEASIVSASARTIVGERPAPDGGMARVDVDDWAWAELEVPEGAHLTVEASRVALGAEGNGFELYGSAGSIIVDLVTGRMELRRFDGAEAAYRTESLRDPWVRAVADLRPPPRLSLGSFVDLHAAGLHHALLRIIGDDPAPGLAPTLADAAAAEALAHAIVEAGMAASRPMAGGRA